MRWVIVGFDPGLENFPLVTADFAKGPYKSKREALQKIRAFSAAYPTLTFDVVELRGVK